MKQLMTIAIVLVATVVGQAQVTPKPADDASVRKGFAAHVAASDLYTAEQKQQIVQLAELVANSPEDAGSMVSAGLMVLYPKFESAVTDIASDNLDRAVTALKTMVDSKDEYLAANAKYYLARAYAIDERYEKALPLLETLMKTGADKTQHRGEATFLRGVCEVETLQRKAALKTLKSFVEKFPNSSERLLIGAMHMIDELAFMEDGTMADVQDRMDYSRRRLDIAESGKRTQDEQNRIIKILDKLIEEAEKKEQQGQGGGSGSGSGQGQGGNPSGNGIPGGPADQSTAPVGQARMGALHRGASGNAEESWGEARDREREEVLNAIKARYPDRYREMIEQYYRSLQEESR
jgi:tetratricopeptide (TPR) repeat protein